MNYVKFFSDLIGVIIRNLFFANFFELFMVRSNIKKSIHYTVYLLAAATSMVLTTLIKETLVLTISLFLFTLILSFLYQSSFFRKIIYSILAMFSMIAAELLSVATTSLFGSFDLSCISNYDIYYFLSVIMYNFILLSSVNIIRLIKNTYTSKLQLSYPIILVYPMVCAITITLINLLMTENTTSTSVIVVLIVVSALILSNICIYYIIDQQNQLEFHKHKLTFIQNQFSSQAQYYQDLQQAQKQICKTEHDMYNNLIAISGLVHNGEYQKALSYLEKWTGTLLCVDRMTRTGYATFDAILNSKTIRASSFNIRIVSYLTPPTNLKIDELDLSILVANALDNAIEASAAFDNGPVIDLKLLSRENYISIFVQNPVKEPVDVSHLVTTKEEKNHHGFGIDSIRAITAKYDGAVDFECTDHQFITRILFKNTAPQSG